MKKIKIKGYYDLQRDSGSNAVINTNIDALEIAKAAKKKRLSLEKRVSDIETKLNTIIKLLENGND